MHIPINTYKYSHFIYSFFVFKGRGFLGILTNILGVPPHKKKFDKHWFAWQDFNIRKCAVEAAHCIQ
jgi:hypothetical protein